jgi:hypothetical protein
MSEKRYSNCCGAPVLGEMDSYKEDGHTYYLGRCSRCKDGAEFLTQEELDEEMNLPDAEKFDVADRRRDELTELNKSYRKDK